MTSQIINKISITPIPVFYRKELGKNAYGDNIGKSTAGMAYSCANRWWPGRPHNSQ